MHGFQADLLRVVKYEMLVDIPLVINWFHIFVDKIHTNVKLLPSY